MTELGAELVAVARLLELPEADISLSERVVARLRAEPAPRVRKRRRRITVAVLTAVAGALAVPVAPAVAGWLGIGGVEVRSVPREPPDTAPPARYDEQLGRKVSIGEAASATGRGVVASAILGEPLAVWLDERGPRPVVTLDFGEVFVTQFATPLETHEVIATKFAGPDVVVEEIQVDGAPGLWLEGAHGIALREPGGGTAYAPMRMSANALVFERDGMTLRVEMDGPKEEALRLALSLH